MYVSVQFKLDYVVLYSDHSESSFLCTEQVILSIKKLVFVKK